MTATRRLAPLSLALSMMLAGATAYATPGGSQSRALVPYRGYQVATTSSSMGPTETAATPARREGIFKSFGKAFGAAVKTGITDFKERRAAAGPGWLSRQLAKTGAAIRSTGTVVKIAVKQEMAATKAELREIGTQIKTDFKKDYAQTKADFKNAGRAIKSNAQAVGREIKLTARDAGYAVGDAAYSVGKGVAHVANKIDNAVDKGVRTLEARHAANVAYRTANKDIASFIQDEKAAGNRDLVTFSIGARKEAHVFGMKVLRGANVAGAALYGASFAVAPNPISAGVAGANVAGAVAMKGAVRDAMRTANTKIVERAINDGVHIDSARLEGWVKSGAINDFTK